MARDILMPQMGYDMTEGTVVRWVKKVGDKVHRGDVVAEIETDKATVEIEAFDSGTLLRIIAGPGETLPVGQPIATLGEPGEALAEAKKPAAPGAASEPAPPTAAAATPPAVAAPRGHAAATPVTDRPAPPPGTRPARPPGETPAASPLARRAAQQAGIDLASVAGSGPGGRIVVADVEAAIDAGPATAQGPA
ncbi:MAG TPA: biotin/lipoyl-containing protein, partial [Candidatus Dormibacteraeota bacterium]|nr:biotin/lipoyl-containing protein [Candidatus Dormibacteraeota bacterium]